MKILFLTKSKKYTNRILKDFIENGYDVAVVCKDYNSFSGSEMETFCKENNVSYFDNDDLYKRLEANDLPKYDLGISNTYGKLIKKELIEWLDGRIINLHGAILPDYKGAFTYNWGLYNLETEWGATAHYVNEKFDEGDIIAVSRFSINPEEISIKTLEDMTQEAAYKLTLEVIEAFKKEKHPKAIKQDKCGKYYSRKDFEILKQINMTDSSEVIKRKIHSCWCPPYEGAYIKMNDEKLYLLDKQTLENI